MLISPKTAIEEGWITHPKCSTLEDWEQFQFLSPNAIDFTVDRLFDIADEECVISENGKIMRSTKEQFPESAERFGPQFYSDEFWILMGKTSVDGLSDFFVSIPDNVCAELIVRSTFSRNGIFITSGLYDSKYEGHIGFAIHNVLSDAFIAKGTRIGQIKFIKSDNVGGYKGGYNHSKGTHWSG